MLIQLSTPAELVADMVSDMWCCVCCRGRGGQRWTLGLAAETNVKGLGAGYIDRVDGRWEEYDRELPIHAAASGVRLRAEGEPRGRGLRVIGEEG